MKHLTQILEQNQTTHIIFDFSGTLAQHTLTGFQVNQELVDFIVREHGSYKFYIWTSLSRISVEAYLKKMGIFEYFELIISSDEVSRLKPDPDGFYHIANPDHIRKTDFLMVGDTNADSGAAAAIGIPCVLVNF